MRDSVLDAPGVWGAGQILAFSALDGPTDYERGLVLRTVGGRAALEVAHPVRAELSFCDQPPSRCRMGSDWLELETPAGGVRAALLDACSLLIEGPCRVPTVAGLTVRRDGPRTLVSSGGAASIGVAPPPRQSIDQAIAARRAWLAQVARRRSWPADRPALAKALCIMKGQVMSPAGQIRRRWATPDRWPHRDMWLWDSAFHAVGWRHVDAALAREMLRAMLDGQRPDGMIPHQIAPGGSSAITQPPVLAMAVERVDQVEPDDGFVADMYDGLCRYVEWDLAHRDADGAGLLEWHIEQTPISRSGESGMDNSSRFDSATALDAPDFNAFAALECEVLAHLAARLGRGADEAKWATHHRRLCGLMNQRLWDEPAGLYMDYDVKAGRRTGVLASSGFLPLVCGAATPEQARRLARHLEPGGAFDSPVPIASISPTQAEHYSKDMWRGPTWINTNWLIAEGFDRYGLWDLAARIRRRSLDEIDRWHAACGSIFEYYDDQGQVPPPRLGRKGPNDPANPYHQVVHDYGWSATLYVDMALRG